MIKKSFFGSAKPMLEYDVLDITAPEPKIIPASKNVTLFLNQTYNFKDSILFKPGDTVKTGQKLVYAESSKAYAVSPVTGKIVSIAAFAGDYGQTYTAVTINVDENEEIDDQFKTLSAEPSLEVAADFLSGAPGNPCFNTFTDPEKPIHTIIICGVDRDLLMTTNQYMLKSNVDAIKSGVGILKKITGIENIQIAVPQHLYLEAAGSGAQVRTVDAEFPSTLPHLMMQALLGQIVPAGQSCEDLGVCFINAEAVASIGTAFDQGHIPFYKTITFIDKNGEQSLISARIGTPLGDILNAFGVTLKENDRVIFGGPMTGAAVYSTDFPVQADTDAIMVQDRDAIPLVSDYPCINCGECIRTCPANIPINVLVRYLEAGEYDTAADQYDLYSCIECGLCSFVCVSRMPVLHYIKLAKYELGRMMTAEAIHA